MKRFVAAMALVLVAGGVSIALLYGLPEPAKPPNVVFILLDTLRFDRLAGQRDGHDIMPNLKRYAEDSLNFANTISQCSWTRPSMASIFTSKDVDVHKVYYASREEGGVQMTDMLRDEYTTPAEWFREHGYQTFAAQTNANLVPELGFAQGFDIDDYPFNNGALGNWVTDTALGGAWAMDEPFYLYAHYMDPHAPYGRPVDYNVPWSPVENVPPEEKALMESEEFMDFLVNWANTTHGLVPAEHTYTLSEASKEYLRERYDADCHYVDAQVGRLVERLRRDFPNTIFVITSDHGEEFFERGTMGHGLTLNQEQLRVPFLIFGRGVEPRLMEAPAALIDVFPTVAGVTGLPPLQQWQGLDLTAGEPPAERARFSRTRGGKPTLGIDLAATQQAQKKLIHDFERFRESLYDLEADPGETRDLLATETVLAEELRALLEDHLAEAEALAGPLEAPAMTELTPEHYEALDALGYMDGGPVETANTPPLTP